MGYAENYANNVSQILQQRGKAQADAALRSGQAWSGALGQIGQTIAQIPQQMQQAQAQQQEQQMRGLNLQLAQGSVANQQAQAQSAAEQKQQQQGILLIAQQLRNADPQVREQALSGLKPDAAEAARKYFQDADSRNLADRKDRAQLAQKTGYDPTAVSVLVGMDHDAGALDHFNQFTQNGTDKEAVKKYVDAVATQGAPLVDTAPKTREITVQNPDGSSSIRIVEDTPGQTFESAPKPVAPKTPQFADVIVNGKPTRAVWDDSTSSWKPTNAAPIPPKGTDSGIPVVAPLSTGQSGTGRNEDYLKQIASQNPGQAGIVRALADGKMAFPTGMALKSDYWQNMLQQVANYDPTFDAVNYNSRLSTRKDFTSGKSAQQVNALNTVVGHLDSLTQAADKLGNSSVPWWNGVSNWVKNATGDPAPKTFEATREAVADELTRVWRQAGGSEADIQERKKSLDTASSPAQFKSVIAQIGDLLESKLESMQNQYQQGMGINDIQMVTPQARAVLDKLRGKSGASGVIEGSGTPKIIRYDINGNVIK